MDWKARKVVKQCQEQMYANIVLHATSTSFDPGPLPKTPPPYMWEEERPGLVKRTYYK